MVMLALRRMGLRRTATTLRPLLLLPLASLAALLMVFHRQSLTTAGTDGAAAAAAAAASASEWKIEEERENLGGEVRTSPVLASTEVPKFTRKLKEVNIVDLKGEPGTGGGGSAQIGEKYSYAFDNFVVDPVTNWTLYDVRLHGDEWPRGEEAKGSWAAPARDRDFAPLNNRSRDGKDEDGGGIAADRWNGTRVVFYNRVPKSGSSTFANFIAKLARVNHFHSHHMVQDKKYWVWRSINRQEEDKLWCAYLSGVDNKRKTKSSSNSASLGEKPPSQPMPPPGRKVFHGHFYFSNLESLESCRRNLPKAAWINLVRDPIERYQSQYYYSRQRERWKKPKAKPSEVRKACRGCQPKVFFSKDMSSCVLTSDPECDFDPDSGPDRETMVTFFCGNAIECRRLGSRAALQAAKSNVEEHYAVVGLLSDLEGFVQLLEAMLPDFFAGAHTLYWKSLKKSRLNAGRAKRPLTPEARKALRADMASDYELVEFITRRFHEQKRALLAGVS